MEPAKLASSLMRMTDEVWMRHANPWSGWTRMASFPLVFLACWSHVWIGWYSLLPIGLLAIWLWINPRIFPRAASTRSWMSQGVLGERVWLNRKSVPIPREHTVATHILSALSVLGVLISAYGFATRDFWAAFMGWNFAVACKVWFVDRMVWLYRDVAPGHAEYENWLY